MTGRPSSFTQEIADEICERLSNGEPLAVICREDKFPTDVTVRNWAKGDDEFSFAIARAREAGHDAIAFRTAQTARGLGDSTGDVQRDKLIIDTDLKLLSKWNPKRYGDKVALVGGDPDIGDKPVQAEVMVRFIRPGDLTSA